ncbi:MAG: hypothetical protein AMS26_15730 [Bacteroides sp. SM23_62]|nr:MAG: hypothetical protein AMS26_15730 [Bacteroides sp. SM23_62]
MIAHVVVIKLNADTPDNVKQLILEKLEKMEGTIGVIRRWEVGTNIGASSNPGDIVVNSAFDSLEDIQTFREHAVHAEFKDYLKPYLEVSYTVDYKI